MDQGLLFRRGSGSGDESSSSVTLQPGSLGYYYMSSNNSSQLGFNLTDPGWFVIPKWFDPWKTTSRGDGSTTMDLHEASFSIVTTMAVTSTSTSTLLFDMLPRLEPPSDDAGGFGPRSFEPVKIDTLENTTLHSGRTIRVTIAIQPPGNDGDLRNSNSARRYSVQIDYNRAAHNLSAHLVLLDGGGTTETETKTSPDGATVHLDDARDTLSPDALVFALSSTMGQLLQLHTWNFTIEVPEAVPSKPGPNTVTILSSVLGSAAAASAIAAAVYLYLNSKYRRWKKDLDQLSKNMQRLPGVPMQVEFADIRKATDNFHESTRLGQGGFGAVYRCRLPAAKKGGGEFMEVAVKKFTRSNNRGYEDFLAEVSIINRLRHKNIVPLVGKFISTVYISSICYEIYKSIVG
jgi:interleukin-1 receptor-associated kinase 1